MAAQFTVLASGSAGNASFLAVDGFGLLIDCGLGPRVLAGRLAAVGLSWQAVSACLISHMHRDHWNALTFSHLGRLQRPLLAHARHHDEMSGQGEYWALRRAGLTREYVEGEPLVLSPTLACIPLRVPHDSDPTFAFRIDVQATARYSAWSIGIASDMGHVPGEIAAAFAEVDLLALEYNHDEELQRASGRPRALIDRVLGDHGHLSNAQAAELTRRIARRRGPDGLQCLIQLHLSRECNRPELAARAGRAALAQHAPTATLITASQTEPTSTFTLRPRGAPTPQAPPGSRRTHQPSLPGLPEDSSTPGPR